MTEAPNPRAARVYVDPNEVDLRLAQLGLSRAPLVHAALAGDLLRRGCTRWDAPMTPGFYMWSRAVSVLREDTHAIHGWHPDDFLRIPVTFNNDETMAVAVTGGDERTGKNGDDPATKTVRGQATIEAVEGNRKLRFGRGYDDSEEPGVDFWYELIYATDEDGVWCEFSRPSTIDPETGGAITWDERIILGRIDPEDGAKATKRRGSVPPQSTPEINVPVRRKSA